MLAWLQFSFADLKPVNVATFSSFKLLYVVSIVALYIYFWIFFYTRKRGAKTLLDGRGALSGSAFILGGATGYAGIEFGIIVSQHTSKLATGNFAIFVGCTVVPILAWIVLYITPLRQRNLVRRSAADS